MQFKVLTIQWLILMAASQSSLAQNSPNLEGALDKIDNPQAWSSVPVSVNRAHTLPASQRQNASRQVMRTLMQSGMQSSSPKSAKQSNSFGGSNAYSDWQRAENEANRAYHYSQTARYDKSEGNRRSAASSADYAARAGRAASDRVYYASNQGDPTAQQYASKARAAADRARANADRARSNAYNYRGR